MATARSIKEMAHEAIDQMADGVTWGDIIENLRFNKAVDEGLAEADQGEFATKADVQAAFQRWGVTLEA